MMDIQFIVRWNDGGKAHSRIYDDENVARKAKKWLMENGAQNIDIAVRINKSRLRRIRHNNVHTDLDNICSIHSNSRSYLRVRNS